MVHHCDVDFGNALTLVSIFEGRPNGILIAIRRWPLITSLKSNTAALLCALEESPARLNSVKYFWRRRVRLIKVLVLQLKMHLLLQVMQFGRKIISVPLGLVVQVIKALVNGKHLRLGTQFDCLRISRDGNDDNDTVGGTYFSHSSNILHIDELPTPPKRCMYCTPSNAYCCHQKFLSRGCIFYQKCFLSAEIRLHLSPDGRELP